MKFQSQRPFLIITCLLLGLSASAQDFDAIIAAGTKDANTYLEHYMSPAVNSFGVGMTDGWYNTAKTHKTLGLDFTLSVNMASIPNNQMMFNFTKAGFQTLKLYDNGTEVNNGKVPTVVGGDANSDYELVVPEGTTITNANGESVTTTEDVSFSVPDGFDLKKVPVVTGVPTPTFNLGIGIYKNTDLKIRFVPEQNFDDYSIKMFGIGVMHDIKQWIPGIKNLPFDLSGFIGTTTLKAQYKVDVDEQDGSTSISGSGNAYFKTHATTVQAIISKKLLFFTPYAALGFNMVKTNFDVKGSYDYSSNGQTVTLTDPVNLDFTGAGGGRFTVGARIKLAVFTFHGAYTFQKYNTLSVGFGLSIR